MMLQIAKRAALGFLLTTLALVNFQAFSQDDKAPKDIQTKKNPVASSDEVLAKAKAAYEENCLMCHGEAGKGDGPMAGMLKEKPADISDAKILSEITDGEIFWLITKGKKPMPPFETKLSEEDRWGLVNLMRAMSKTKPNTNPRKAQ
jgi:mono/diheme cytochrome c family protein